jgi:uroporphyrinogen-III synthase
MRVLVTRAAEDAARTAESLAAAGHEAVLAPVIEIVATGADWPDGLFDAVLATSAHAFAMLDSGPSLEVMRLMPLHLVGERTAAIARLRGFEGAATIAANAAELLARFGSISGAPRRLLYLAGRHRKPDIETALEVAAQDLHVLEVYEAKVVAELPAAVMAQIRAQKIDAALHFSRRSASLFGERANAAGLDVSKLRHLCLSNDVATPLRQRGLPLVEVAGSPNEAALLACLDREPVAQDA